MYKFAEHNPNEVLISDPPGWTHFSWRFKKEIELESNIIKIKEYEFDLSAGAYQLTDSNNSFSYKINDNEENGMLADGSYTVDTSSLTDVKIEVEADIKYFKLNSGTWEQYTPEPPQSTLEVMQAQIEELALAILQQGV